MSNTEPPKETVATELTHIDQKGRARMVDVGAKEVTERIATAQARISKKPETLALIESGGAKKGDVLAAARIAGIQGAEKCSDLIPLCHPLALTSIEIQFDLDRELSEVQIEATVKLSGKTGVEMEALTAVSIAALTIYDMCKAVDRGMVIQQIGLMAKSGGKSGDWQRTFDH